MQDGAALNSVLASIVTVQLVLSSPAGALITGRSSRLAQR